MTIDQRIVVTLIGALVAAGGASGAAPPQMCRIQGGNTKTIWGTGFDAEAVVHTADLPLSEDDALEALGTTPYDSGAFLPDEPPADARKPQVLAVGEGGRVLAGQFRRHYNASGFYDARAGQHVCWVQTADGVSKPRLVRAARPWFVYPQQATPGQVLRIIGRNIDARLVALKGRDNGSIRALPDIGAGRHPVYECWARLPEDLPVGKYEVYVHNGTGGKAGWGGPIELEITRRPQGAPTVMSAREFDAKADGIHDDTEALQAALQKAKDGGPAIVHLPPGRYPITETLEVPPGVTLAGAGQGATTIQVLAGRPMTVDFPPEAQLEGYARDWLPHMRGHGYAPMVWLRDRAGLTDLTLRSGPGVGIGVLVARCPGVARDIRIERCEIVSTHSAGNWVPSSPIRIAGDTYGLAIRDCRIRGQGGIHVISTSNRSAHIARNSLGGIPAGRHNTIFLRGFIDSVIEDNMAENGMRNFCSQLGRKLGKHEYDEGQQAPSASFYHVLLQGNLFRNGFPRRHNAGETMYEAGGAFWHGHIDSAAEQSVTVEGTPFWTDMTGTYILVIDGRGLGQYRRVASNTEDTLRLAEPWEIIPDASTHISVNGAFVETLWIDNTEDHTSNWTGFWGNNFGHVIDGHVLRDGAGLYLWAWQRDNPSPVAFCDIIGSRAIGRGTIRLIGPLVFGNTIRFSEVVDFRYRPGMHIQPTWVQGMAPDERPAISLGRANHEIEGLAETAPLKDWNIIDGSHIYDGPRGIYIAPQADYTVLRRNAIHVSGESLVDESETTVVK